ncbi:MAG: twin transmembrane helix small protein [Alphaproteobacteria bacterium]|nr:twin transmembrane helix small protein [Alphaproteobacteria bacterium]
MTRTFLFTALLITLASTVGALGFGLFALYKGGEFNEKYGNGAMRWRITFQALSIILFTLLILVGK